EGNGRDRNRTVRRLHQGVAALQQPQAPRQLRHQFRTVAAQFLGADVAALLAGLLPLIEQIVETLVDAHAPALRKRPASVSLWLPSPPKRGRGASGTDLHFAQK